MQGLGNQQSLAYEPWPVFEEKHLASDTFKLPVQVIHPVIMLKVCEKGDMNAVL